MPTGVKLGVAETAPEGFASSGLALVNHTGIAVVFERFIANFDIMFDNHAYTHWYENAGVSRDMIAPPAIPSPTSPSPTATPAKHGCHP